MTTSSIIYDPSGQSGFWTGTDSDDQLFYIGSNDWEYEFVDGLAFEDIEAVLHDMGFLEGD